MITEETIREHKYFAEGGRMWMLESVENVRVARLRRIDKKVSEGSLDVVEVPLGRKGWERFVPVPPPAVPADSVELIPDTNRVTSDEPQGAEEPQARRETTGEGRSTKKPTGPHRGRKSRTPYVGVQVRDTKTKGKRYTPTVTEGGKTIRVGKSCDSAELAAAVIADHKGDKTEAARLRELHAKKTGGDRKQIRLGRPDHQGEAEESSEAGGGRTQRVSETCAKDWADGDSGPTESPKPQNRPTKLRTAYEPDQAIV